MADSLEQGAIAPQPGSLFGENHVEADGFRIRYREGGWGEAVVFVHGGGGLQLTKLHDLLTEHYRVVALEIPGFGTSPVNERSKTLEELARTMNAAVAALGIEKFSVTGHSFGGKLALWMAVLEPEKVQCAVLMAPAAFRPEMMKPLTPEEMRGTMYAHPERMPPTAPPPPELVQKQMGLAMRLIGPARDAAFEARLRDLKIPVLALFGTADRLIPPEMARLYRDTLPNCHITMVYDAAHAVDSDRPEAVFAIARDFLARREGFVVTKESGAIFP